jgi:hypothetical protein
LDFIKIAPGEQGAKKPLLGGISARSAAQAPNCEGHREAKRRAKERGRASEMA